MIANKDIHPSYDSQEFALQLFRRLSSSENLVFSPTSIFLALSMAAIGSEGVTLSEFQNLLKFNSRKQLFDIINNLQNNLIVNSKGVKTAIANKIFEGLPSLNKEYEQLVKSKFDAAVEKVDFKLNPNATRVQINSWVEEATQKKISNLLPPDSVDSNTKMVLVNAIYFKGTWQYTFDKNKTTPSKFNLAYSEAGTQSDALFMNISKEYDFYEGKLSKYISIPYVGNQYAMEIILPNNIEEYEKNFSAASFAKLRGKKRRVKVELSLPKFKIQATSSTSLKSILQSMGLSSCFDDSANFKFMDTLNSVKVSDVFHKAMIEVNEEGAEAAAATAVVMTMRGMIKRECYSMYITSPFFYSITHLPSGTSIFLGKITRPSY